MRRLLQELWGGAALLIVVLAVISVVIDFLNAVWQITNALWNSGTPGRIIVFVIVLVGAAIAEEITRRKEVTYVSQQPVN